LLFDGSAVLTRSAEIDVDPADLVTRHGAFSRYFAGS